MDLKKFSEILKKYNNGSFRGSKRKLAKELGCTEGAISNFFYERAKPSEEMLNRMAKVLNVKITELQKIFNVSDLNICSEKNDNIINENNIYKERNKLLEEKVAFLEKQVKFLEEQVSFYKQRL